MDCEAAAKVKGRCHRCYQRVRRQRMAAGEHTPERYGKNAGRECSVEGCDRAAKAKGMCNMHYLRVKNGLELDGPPRKHYGAASERFWKWVDQTGECWLWTGTPNPDGYGTFNTGKANGGKIVKAHRFAYEDAVGPIPAGAVLDHLCRNSACVNPSHLQPVTPDENYRRGQIDRFHPQPSTECPNCGHRF